MDQFPYHHYAANINMNIPLQNYQMQPQEFFPAAFLDLENEPTFPFVLLVLNSPILRGDLYETCASRAMAIIAADGGGNRIFDYVKKTQAPNLMNQLRPETIIGDLDSLRPETQKFFQERGTTIVRDDDQYATDFMKALKHIASQTNWWLNSFSQRTGRQEEKLKVLIFGGLGGRADQAFSQVHHLYSVTRDPAFSQLDLYLVADDSVMFVLPQGASIIHTPRRLLGENVGIIPIGRPASITISGFEWDVTNWETEFGSQISTSNHIRAPQVSVASTERVLFTVEIIEAAQSHQGQKGAPEAENTGSQTEARDPSTSIWSWT